ncbi:MAG: S-layer homology domain-containing protein [Clostridia bacterium]|nr:S-layer homology domain-containing protein [Clostridia bacterium]
MKKFLIFLLIFIQAVPCFCASSDKMQEILSTARADGIILGDGKGNLHEEQEATRAEFLTFLVRFLELSGGENVFSDVSDGDWFEPFVSAANFSGIFSGFEDGTARPYDLIKTEDAVSIIGRYYNAVSHKGSYSGVSDYAEDYFGYAFENGVFSDWKYLPVPKRSITREEIISVLYKYREINSKNSCFAKNYPKLSKQQTFNRVCVDVKTLEDCSVYYALQKKGERGYRWESFSENLACGTEETIYIGADINSTYNVYVKAVSRESGRTQIKEIQNAAPLAFIRGYGTESNPYVIYTELQLTQIANFPDRAYVLGTDIDISKKWTPVKNFSGSIDGGGYRITGLSVTGNTEGAGLFADINGGTVKNLTVDADIKAKNSAGIIAGENNGGVITGCCVTGNVEVNGNNGGGICGINKGEIKNCLSCAYTVAAGSFAGGIAGQNRGHITECLSCAETVKSDMYAGGIAGQNNGGTIENCAAVNIAVYNTMTYNGGKISTNRKDGKMQNNFSLSDMVSNAARTEDSADSRNGLQMSWESFTDPEFYFDIGWDRRNWQTPSGGFVLVCPKNAAEPMLESGRTPYFPKEIYDEDGFLEIRKNVKGHYVLARDIALSVPFKTIDAKDGFSGTLDGNGHTIYNLVLRGESGLFSNITGGTVKNLKIENVKATNINGAVITACNYGYIENCMVSGEIYTERAKQAGTFAGENNGSIEGCEANVRIIGESGAAIGGICAVNNAVVSKSKFSGTIQVAGTNSVFGGICGFDNSGYISECVSYAETKAEGTNSVFGGICAISSGSQIYKCASGGNIYQSANGAISGGICARMTGSVIYNCFSLQNAIAESENAISGGICAEAYDSNIQNTYSAGNILLSGEDAVSGGICAKAQDTFITQNVALNPKILGKKSAGAIVGEYEVCDISDNYRCAQMRINAGTVPQIEKNGTKRTAADLLNTEFYLKPLSENGLLGWDETAWEKSGTQYSLPVLSDMPSMEKLSNPVYK